MRCVHRKGSRVHRKGVPRWGICLPGLMWHVDHMGVKFGRGELGESRRARLATAAPWVAVVGLLTPLSWWLGEPWIYPVAFAQAIAGLNAISWLLGAALGPKFEVEK